LLSVESVVPQSKIGTTGTLLYVTVISCLWDTAEDAGPPCHMVSLDYVEMAHSDRANTEVSHTLSLYTYTAALTPTLAPSGSCRISSLVPASLQSLFLLLIMAPPATSIKSTAPAVNCLSFP
jgi:hypothetical protein